MFTIWKYRINMIIPISERDIINALWTIIAPNGGAEVPTFGISLSPNGQEPVTHSAISTAGTHEMLVFIQEIFSEELQKTILRIQDYKQNDFRELVYLNGLQRVDEEKL